MLRKQKDLNGFSISAMDGNIGSVEDFLYDYYGCPIYWNKGDGRAAEAFA